MIIERGCLAGRSSPADERALLDWQYPVVEHVGFGRQRGHEGDEAPDIVELEVIHGADSPPPA